MNITAGNIYPKHYLSLERIVSALMAGQTQAAEVLIKDIVNELGTSVNTFEVTQTLFFLEALRRNLGERTADIGNLYLLPDQGQQIKMFNFMADKFPLVRYAQNIVNSSYRDVIGQQSAATVLDIGIGTGQQMVRLIDMLAQSGELPETLTIIGIEPSGESLASAESTMQTLMGKYPCSLRFIPIQGTLESFTDDAWDTLKARIAERPGTLIVNASFALHHVYPPDVRAGLFERLRGLNPAVFAMIEPYADFLDGELATRFQNAWLHYGLTFRAIDQIEAPQDDKNLLKKVFFSREIQDVLSLEPVRIEQFETGEMWAQRLIKAGFKPVMPADADVSGPAFPLVTVTRNEGYIAFNVDGSPIVSILIARPC